MVKEIKLEFNVKPVPKGRPRFARGRVFTPKATANFEKTLGVIAKTQMLLKSMERFIGPVEMMIHFEYRRPKKTVLSSPRADLDNLMKAVGDALNGIVFDDDRQVVVLGGMKEWSHRDFITVQIRSHSR